MSYSSVCQGLQSSVEPCLLEPRVLKLKLAPPGSNSNLSPPPSQCPASKTLPHTPNHQHGNKNWTFLQSLSNISHCKDPETHKVYVHPSVKRSSSMLSAKSLELCTESLGCETGSNASDDTQNMSLFSLESIPTLRSNDTPVVMVTNKNSQSKRLNKRGSGTSTFPPPLTSMGEVSVRSHREDGRLILEAVTSSSPQPYFEAERGNGRLRLRLFESEASCYDDEVADDEGLKQQVSDEEEEEGQEQEQEEDDDDDNVLVEEELEEYVGNSEDEMGMTKFVRPSRCKESGNRVIFGDGYFEHPPLSLCL
ncbi:protein FANTASTIC FOUR 2-like [Vigna umbellata]|uniref:protein FANTASTIC FOUR 2-like n=1 Tax=Vigna umbellata TaxID=87088 RepID=UPI001F5ED3BB|nr:protein FANTASTIC FOUR 2-like [Vigna umbellata]